MDSSGGVAEWLGRGLQSPVLRFESGRRLQELTSICSEKLFTVVSSALPLSDRGKLCSKVAQNTPGGLRNGPKSNPPPQMLTY